MNTKLYSQLILNRYTLPVHIGDSEKERRRAQKVAFTVTLNFFNPAKKQSPQII